MREDKNCVFCKIVAGDLPYYAVYEDDNCLAILDIHPASKGHTVLITKKHFETMDELSEDLLGQVMQAAQKVAKNLKQYYELDRVAQAVIGLDVAHAHVNIIPIFVGNEIKVVQDFDSEPDHAQLSVLANRLKVGELDSE